MNTRISSLLLKQNDPSVSKRVSPVRIGVQVLDIIASMILAVFGAIFVMWINGRQHEFDELQDRPK